MSQAASLRSAGSQGDWPPSWNVGEHSIAVGRCIDPAFAKLEFEKLWSKVLHQELDRYLHA
jgi:hypothetical protein